MTAATKWAPPRSAMSLNFTSLLDKLVKKHEITNIDDASFEEFAALPGDVVILFVDDPDRSAESWDMAVIFPDIVAAVGARIHSGLLRPELALKAQSSYGIGRIPALLFLRDGGYVGVLEGLRDWTQFISDFQSMLQKPVSRKPGIGIEVTSIHSGCH